MVIFDYVYVIVLRIRINECTFNTSYDVIYAFVYFDWRDRHFRRNTKYLRLDEVVDGAKHYTLKCVSQDIPRARIPHPKESFKPAVIRRDETKTNSNFLLMKSFHRVLFVLKI